MKNCRPQIGYYLVLFGQIHEINPHSTSITDYLCNVGRSFGESCKMGCMIIKYLVALYCCLSYRMFGHQSSKSKDFHLPTKIPDFTSLDEHRGYGTAVREYPAEVDE